MGRVRNEARCQESFGFGWAATALAVGFGLGWGTAVVFLNPLLRLLGWPA